MMNEAEKLAAQLDDQDAAKEAGMVYQVWNDGEITLQKAGDLLWRRSLHCIHPGLNTVGLSVEKLTLKHESGKYTFVWVRDETDAFRVRQAIAKQLGVKDYMNDRTEELIAKRETPDAAEMTPKEHIEQINKNNMLHMQHR